MLRDILRRKAPGLPLSISYEVLPEIKEYERTSTTVINAYVMPIVATYLKALRQALDEAGVPARLLLMQSNGGLTTDSAAVARPMNIIESGPAGGVVGGQALARAKGLDKIITFDMGGTTAKASTGRGRRGDARHGVCGRRRHHDRLAAADRRRLHAEGAGHRSRRGRRRRRLAGLDRPRRRAADRPRERRRRPRPGLLRQGRRDADRDRRQCRARLPQPRPSRRRRIEAQCRQGAGCAARPGSPSRSGCRSKPPPMARI